MSDEDITSWQEMELILNIYHTLRQSSTASLGYTQMLAEGSFGFVNHEQKAIIEQIHAYAKEIRATVKWITIWLTAHASET